MYMIEIKLDDLIWQYRVTAEQIAKETGLSKNTISKMRNSKNSNISISTLDKLCEYFECDVCDLLSYSKND